MKPEPEFGTDEIRWRKDIAAGNDTFEQVAERGFKARSQKPEQRDDTDLSPIGILLACQLITDRQHGLAVQFLALHGQVFAAAPRLRGNSIFQGLPSAPSNLDVPKTPMHEVEEWESRRDRYNQVRGSLSLPRWKRREIW